MALQCRLVDEPSEIPGDMWFCPWYCGPLDDQLERIPDFLSIHYREDWKGKRAPLAVRCPDGSIWVVDQVSSNGTGWKVTGDAPNITCQPSIVVTNYHGFLQNGVFTDDLENRKY